MSTEQLIKKWFETKKTRGNVPQAIRAGDKVVFKLSAAHIERLQTFDMFPYSIKKRLELWVDGEVLRTSRSSNGQVAYEIKSIVPRRISGFYHFHIEATNAEGYYGGIVIRKPDAAIYKGKRK